MQQRAAQHVERARTVLQLWLGAGVAACGRRLVTHPLEGLRANEKTNRIAGRIVFFLRRGAALEADDFQSRGGKLLGHNAAQATHSDDANVGYRLRHGAFPASFSSSTATGSRSTRLLI